MSPRVRTAFRPLETTASFEAHESVSLRRAATSVPSFSYYGGDGCAPERLQLLSRLEQRWCPSRPSSTCNQRAACAAPVPLRQYAPSASGSSRPSSSSSLVEEESLACMELRGILGYLDENVPASSRSSSASSSTHSAQLMPLPDHEVGLFPLEEIVVGPCSPITRSANPMPLDAGFGAAF
ncbi:hypothetical protein GGF46_004845 [Coemansia sp. RSA 552]|nr:hypothetical protein GGF46_004845 [Coemansia sp. RSA 552]